MSSDAAMPPDVCLKALGLKGPASRRELHRAYHRMALRYHPDRCGDDPRAVLIFRRINAAYARLRMLPEGDNLPSVHAVCSVCRCIARVLPTWRGRRYCADCLFRRLRRCLPAPNYRTVYGTATIACQLLAVTASVQAALTEDVWMAAVGFMAALASFAALSLVLIGVERIDS